MKNFESYKLATSHECDYKKKLSTDREKKKKTTRYISNNLFNKRQTGISQELV